MELIEKMGNMFNSFSVGRTLEEYYSNDLTDEREETPKPNRSRVDNDVELYDVVYACIVDEK
jgi:hypothetical protein